jgi:16S rRNA (adenine1518-N6/adenine1519-N6)-dimethyltransferase
MSRQPLGQHFLADGYWREEIARAIRVSPPSEVAVAESAQQLDFCWIEIGPGHGEMTEYLVATGAPVHVVEVDQFLIGNLNRLKKKNPNLDVICGDILETDLAAAANGKRMRIYGSLPYYITSPILHHLFQFAELIEEIHVVVQTEVAERMAAQPGSKAYGYLSVATQLNSRPELVLEIPRAAFTPPPEVASTLVTLRLPGGWEELRRGGLLLGEHESAQQKVESEEDFLEFVKLCFSKKRKTLVNNLRELAEPDKVRKALGAVGLRPDARAEQISISNFGTLYEALRSRSILRKRGRS